jgi:hypothetical protein
MLHAHFRRVRTIAEKGLFISLSVFMEQLGRHWTNFH